MTFVATSVRGPVPSDRSPARRGDKWHWTARRRCGAPGAMPFIGTPSLARPAAPRVALRPRNPTCPMRVQPAHARRRRGFTSVSALHAGRPAPPALGTALLLASVPALWGSFGVAVKLVFVHAPYLPASVLNVVTYAIAAGALTASRAAGDARRAAALKRDLAGLPDARPERASRRATYAAGAELGGYLFAGSYAQLLSLEYTSTSRAAVLVQLTTVFVPVAAALFGQERANVRTFAAAAVALCGVAVLSVDGQASLALAINGGDALSVLSALFYTVHVVRLQTVLPRFPDVVRLVEVKAIAQLVFGSVALLFLLREGEVAALLTGPPRSDAASLLVSLLSLLWIGAMTTAVATVAQVEGQRRVGPSVSAVVFSLQPVFAVVLAMLILHDHVSPNELVGGALVVIAGLAVVF
jgi:drug/metabolite transporter (DMT)-like permease